MTKTLLVFTCTEKPQIRNQKDVIVCWDPSFVPTKHQEEIGKKVTLHPGCFEEVRAVESDVRERRYIACNVQKCNL